IAATPARVDAYGAGDGPARLPQPLQERADAGLSFHIVLSRGHEHADAPPSSDMNWRRLMRSPRAEGHTSVEALYHMSEAVGVTVNSPGNGGAGSKNRPLPSLRRGRRP